MKLKIEVVSKIPEGGICLEKMENILPYLGRPCDSINKMNSEEYCKYLEAEHAEFQKMMDEDGEEGD